MTGKILILDFGSQYTQLIARAVREANVYCEIIPYHQSFTIDGTLKGIILSGSPFSVNDINAPSADILSFIQKTPVLGICYGAQITVKEFGGIDILINNAGISMRALFEDTELEVIRKVMDINFYGTVYATKYALPHIIKTKGSIIGVSSIAGYRGLPGRTGYSASKFAMQGFLEALRTELLPENVHVMVACPGFTASNIRNTALAANGKVQGESPRDEGKMMTAERCAHLCLRAIEKKKRTLVLTFTGKRTVFMQKFFPKLADRFTYNFFFKNGKLAK